MACYQLENSNFDKKAVYLYYKLQFSRNSAKAMDTKFSQRVHKVMTEKNTLAFYRTCSSF